MTISKKINIKPERFYLGISLLVLGIILAFCLRQSLIIDEFQTYFVVKDSLKDAIDRARDTQAFSPFYFILEWFVTKTFGTAPIALRFLSYAFVLLSIFAVYQLGTLLRDRETGAIAALLFVSQDSVINAAIHARPYGLGLFFITISTLFLERWLRSGKTMQLFCYTITAALAPYCQYFFGGIYFIHLFRIYFKKERENFSIFKYSLSLVTIALLNLPLLNHLMLQWKKREMHEIAELPSYLRLILEWGNFPLLLLLLLAFLFAHIFKRPILTSPASKARPAKEDVKWLITWACFPSLLLFLISNIGGTSVFLDRFYAWATPGVALLLASLICFVRKEALPLIAAIFTLLLLVSETTKTTVRFAEDWAGAAKYSADMSRHGEVVLLYSGLHDQSAIPSLKYPEQKDCFPCAPSYFYKFGEKVVSVPILHEFGKKAAYIDSVLKPILEAKQPLVLVAYDRETLFRDNIWITTPDELENWLASFGYKAQSKKRFRDVWVVKLTAG